MVLRVEMSPVGSGVEELALSEYKGLNNVLDVALLLTLSSVALLEDGVTPVAAALLVEEAEPGSALDVVETVVLESGGIEGLSVMLRLEVVELDTILDSGATIAGLTVPVCCTLEEHAWAAIAPTSTLLQVLSGRFGKPAHMTPWQE